MSVYEVHLGSWRPGLTYRELADQLVEHVVQMGFTHVELLPVAEHPFGGSWGYQVSSYYAPTSRFGHPDDFRLLVDRLHQAGVGVIIDWVPAHFPKDEWALGRFDGTPLYEHPDPLLGEHPDWGTYVFNFGRNEVRNFLVANATYWLEEFHIDGLRVDAVASMLYLDYSRSARSVAPERPRRTGEPRRDRLHPGGQRHRLPPDAGHPDDRRGVHRVARRHDRRPSSGGLGYGFKWNMGWMNDTLRYLAEEPINRRYHHNEITFSLVYAFSEQFILPISHDEVVHGKGSLMHKMPGEHLQQAAGLRSLLTYQWTHPGKQLLFMGCEFGQTAEWSESRSLDWHLLEYPTHQGIARLVVDLNRLYRSEPALWALDHDGAGFEWIDSQDAGHNVISYIRRDGTGRIAVVVGQLRRRHARGLPARPAAPVARGERSSTPTPTSTAAGVWATSVWSRRTAQPLHAQGFSASVRLPSLGAIVLVPEGQ